MRVLWWLILALMPLPAFACGADTDCMLGERHYRIAMPEGHDGVTPVPAILFAHGYQGSAAGVMRNGSLRRLATDLGAALIAGKSVGPGWDLPNNPREMDSTGAAEFAYFDAVIADATARFAIDGSRIMATGFSGGGMMVWNLICARSSHFAGFAPIAGTFWLEAPETCEAPVASVIHIHGDADRMVPLDGRVIGPTKQGEVSQALAMYRAFGGFGEAAQTSSGDLRCAQSGNDAGQVLDFCLFSGGHSFRTEHVRHAWERLLATGAL